MASLNNDVTRSATLPYDASLNSYCDNWLPTESRLRKTQMGTQAMSEMIWMMVTPTIWTMTWVVIRSLVWALQAKTCGRPSMRGRAPRKHDQWSLVLLQV